MKIGFDVDGVLVDMYGYQRRLGEEYFEKKRGFIMKNPQGFDIKDIYGCSNTEREKFWFKYIWRYCLFEPMTKDAAKISKELKEKGHVITIVTGRAHTTEDGVIGNLFRWMLKHWLKKNHFLYDEIFYCTESDSAIEKLDICKKNNVDVLIDDKAENLLVLEGQINIICYPAIWNEGIKELDKYRVNNMEEVLERIDLLSV